jgi:hypothetical protein
MGVPIAVAICLGILAIALMVSSAFLHWFIIPLFACGLLCCLDAVHLLDNKGRDLFDPVPLLGLFGLYFFYVAPLLHVGLGYWFINRYFAPTDRPEDWRTWLGGMGIINFFGLAIYRACHKRFAKSPAGTVYRLRTSALRLYGFPLLALTLMLQIYVYVAFGGLGGYVDAYANARRDQGFQGLGWMLCIAESFPVLLLIVFVATHKATFRSLPTLKLAVLLSVISVLILIFGGLRGSRSNTVISLIIVVVIIHAMVQRLSWRFFATFGAAVVAFMYIYGFYKVSPDTFWTALTSSESRAIISQSSGRDLDGVLLGDLERSDIQAYLLFRIMQDGSQVRYGYGATYLDGMLNFIPRGLSSYRPPGKLKYGTNAIFGDGSYAEGRFAATKVYGLAGESMLNFGVCGVPVAFLAFGIVVGRLRAFGRRLEPGDSRQFMLPILSILCVVALSSDVDNLIFVFLQNALIPGILIWCSSSRTSYTDGPFVARAFREVCLIR